MQPSMWPCSGWMQHHTLHRSGRRLQLITYMALSTMAPQPEEMVSSSGSTCSPCRHSAQWAGCWSCQGNSAAASTDQHSAVQQLQTQLADWADAGGLHQSNRRCSRWQGRICCVAPELAVGKILGTPQPEMLQPL